MARVEGPTPLPDGDMSTTYSSFHVSFPPLPLSYAGFLLLDQ